VEEEKLVWRRKEVKGTIDGQKKKKEKRHIMQKIQQFFEQAPAIITSTKERTKRRDCELE